MEISADGNASIIGVRRTEVLIFNIQFSSFQAFFAFIYLLGEFFQNCTFGLQHKNPFTTNFKKLCTFTNKYDTIGIEQSFVEVMV